LVPQHGFEMVNLKFAALRGKGLLRKLLLPLNLLKGFWQAQKAVRQVNPNVVLGMGGYITFPGGMMASLWSKPLVLHEQNSVAGLANKVLAQLADRVFTAFPGVFKTGQWVGNPLRRAFTEQATPADRFAGRSGPLRVLVVGGSLGAKALNDIVPQALALMPEATRPQVIHQSGAKQIEALRANYANAGVQAELTPFIDDTASAFAHADLVICRAGASTVTELAAVGVAALYVPFPFAVDDHQTTNAQFLVAQGGGWLVPQAELTAQNLAERLTALSRDTLQDVAQKAHAQKKTNATREVVMACEELAT
jgi:UDP-N-acetylglucosamine--N-acetylmuramyl-(pentapeptide) pyrophosphoryl-undecaprenol N-acetylglucosamine transferase